MKSDQYPWEATQGYLYTQSLRNIAPSIAVAPATSPLISIDPIFAIHHPQSVHGKNEAVDVTAMLSAMLLDEYIDGITLNFRTTVLPRLAPS